MRKFLPLFLALLLAACSPKLDWREVRSSNAPYSILLPAKPSSFAREIDLDGLHVTMSMTAAEADNATFAVGSAELADAAQVPHALAAMQAAMVNNIRGTIRKETRGGAIDIEATGTANSQPVVLYARFLSHDKHVVQVILLGKENAIVQETVETFFGSFQLH